MEAATAVAPRIVAEIRGYGGLLSALRARRERLQLSIETLDELAGLTPRHSQKILGITPQRGLSRMTLPLLLGAMGLKLAIVEEEEAIKRLAPRWRKRQSQYVRPPRKPRAKDHRNG